MCDAISLAKGVTDLAAGNAQAIDARSRGRLETAQLDAMRTSVFVDAQAEEGQLRRVFGDQMKQNMAAIAVSGLDATSFEAITKGNAKDMQEAIGTVWQNAGSKASQITTETKMAALNAKMESSAALFGGFVDAGMTAFKADQSYQQNHLLDEGRWSYFMRSIGR